MVTCPCLKKTLHGWRTGSGFSHGKSWSWSDKCVIQETDFFILRGSCRSWTSKLCLQMARGQAQQMIREAPMFLALSLALQSVLWAGCDLSAGDRSGATSKDSCLVTIRNPKAMLANC